MGLISDHVTVDHLLPIDCENWIIYVYQNVVNFSICFIRNNINIRIKALDIQ